MTKRAAFLLAVALVACGRGPDAVPVALRVLATPVPTPTPEPTPTPTPVPTPAPTRAATAPPRTRPPATARAVAAAPASGPSMFTGLGGWLDWFDFSDDPASVLPKVRDIHAKGVRTLYIETSRSMEPNHIEHASAVGAALDEAHGLGLRVVAWYPPDFDPVDFDVERSLAAVRFVSPGGRRFDAFGADIERKDVADHGERSRRMLEYSRKLREGSAGLPLAAIVYPPLQLAKTRSIWPDFPWAEMAASYDVVMPMSYWKTGGLDEDPAAWTSGNITETRRLTGKPVHIIGGLAEYLDVAAVSAYVQAAVAGGSLGGGLYDYASTRDPALWGPLAGLNR